MTIALKNLMNDIYAKDISQKVYSALDTKKRSGEFIGNFAVYGYVKSPEDRHMVSGKVSAEDYQHKRGRCEKHIQRLEIKIKVLEDAKRQAKEEELSTDNIILYTNVRTLTRELVDSLIQNIYIYSSTSIEIVWKCGDEYQRLLADTAKKEAAEHEQG